MATVWVVNASPAIVLAKIGRLDLLARLADDVLLPKVVAAELMAGPAGDPARTAVAGGWGTRITPDTVPTEIIEWGLGAGESAVIALARQRHDAVAVLDDAEARACARAMNVPVTGTLGLVARGFRAGLVSSLKDTIDELRKAGYSSMIVSSPRSSVGRRRRPRDPVDRSCPNKSVRLSRCPQGAESVWPETITLPRRLGKVVDRAIE